MDSRGSELAVDARVAGLLALFTGSTPSRWAGCVANHTLWLPEEGDAPELVCSCDARAPLVGTPGAAWEAAVCRGYVPAAWLEPGLLHAATCAPCGGQGVVDIFGCRACRRGEDIVSRGVVIGRSPTSFGSILGAATDPERVARAEAIARELLDRLAPWGVTASEVALWCPSPATRHAVALPARRGSWMPELVATRAAERALPLRGWPPGLWTFDELPFAHTEAWAGAMSRQWQSPRPDPYRPLLDLADVGYRPWFIDAEALVIVER